MHADRFARLGLTAPDAPRHIPITGPAPTLAPPPATRRPATPREADAAHALVSRILAAQLGATVADHGLAAHLEALADATAYLGQHPDAPAALAAQYEAVALTLRLLVPGTRHAEEC